MNFINNSIITERSNLINSSNFQGKSRESQKDGYNNALRIETQLHTFNPFQVTIPQIFRVGP